MYTFTYTRSATPCNNLQHLTPPCNTSPSGFEPSVYCLLSGDRTKTTQHPPTQCNPLQYIPSGFGKFGYKFVGRCYSDMLQQPVALCNTLQQRPQLLSRLATGSWADAMATPCNNLQHPATHYNIESLDFGPFSHGFVGGW